MDDARHASRKGVFGWVRNEPDGSVRLVVEGRREDIDAFLLALEADSGGQIRFANSTLECPRGVRLFRILQG